MILRFTQRPRELFLLDGAGATLSALLLISTLLSNWSGMPERSLKVLLVIAVIMAAYSLVCSWRIRTNWRPLLRVICIANFVYCALTLTLVFLEFSRLTTWGKSYFLLEALLIATLGALEIMVLRTGKRAAPQL